MKKFMCLLLCVLCLFSCSLTAFAAEGDDIPIAEDIVSEGVSEGFEELSEDVGGGIVEVVFPDRPLMTTPFNEYSVTEGFLLFISVGLLAAAVISICKGVFASW